MYVPDKSELYNARKTGCAWSQRHQWGWLQL